MQKNANQREEQKLIGGITGKGFLRGKSGNPKGRPHTTGLLTALRNKIGEVDADGMTVEARLVEVLVSEALVGKNRLPAVEVIFDRLEGRSRQRVEVADVSAELRNKSDFELQFHLDNGRWPDAEELVLMDTAHDGAE